VCTVSWWRKGDSYGVLFNRDESRKRLEAQPPSTFLEGDCSYLSPVDSDAGGTWIWVNRYGLIGCVLNNYSRHDKVPGHPVSRGLLLKSLACQKTIIEIRAEIDKEELENYRPFFLLLIAAESIALLSWDGGQFGCRMDEAVSVPITTSGYKPEEVIAYRKEQFEKLTGRRPEYSFEDLLLYQCQHDPHLPTHSVLMSRPHARTVSQSQVRVEPKEISFSYATVSEQAQLEPAKITRLSRV
jgi:uncharacterized protein with NRDE domain